jgi:site-specific DNA-cytosine methylase
MKILLINSYAGSLLIASKQEGHEIIASLEDKGYGLECQRLNYPDVDYVSKPPWPDLNLEEAICLGHPPCSCFSNQNCSKERRGLDSEAFKSSRMAIEYALERRVKGLAIESVTATLEGARSYHDEVAEDYGYHLYRVLQNAISFGLPQWRPRFWAIFVRKNLGLPDKMWFHHKPVFRTVGECLEGVEPGETIRGAETYYQKNIRKFAEKGLDLKEILGQEDVYSNVAFLAARYLGMTDPGMSRTTAELKFRAQYGVPTGFHVSWLCTINPGGFTGVIMSDSHWCLGDRLLTRPEYCAIAGFPPDYKFDKLNEARAYLSRGVAPPVARWVLRQVVTHLEQTFDPSKVTAITDRYVEAAPGEVVDFRVSKSELKQMKLFDLDREER